MCNVPATEKFLPSSLWLLGGAKANSQQSHHKLLLMFQEKRSSSSCRLLGRWWCKHEDAKRISRMCMHHLSGGKELTEVEKRATEWKLVHSCIEMEFYIATKQLQVHLYYNYTYFILNSSFNLLEEYTLSNKILSRIKNKVKCSVVWHPMTYFFRQNTSNWMNPPRCLYYTGSLCIAGPN